MVFGHAGTKESSPWVLPGLSSPAAYTPWHASFAKRTADRVHMHGHALKHLQFNQNRVPQGHPIQTVDMVVTKLISL